jgi:serine/threonine-protein kinase
MNVAASAAGAAITTTRPNRIPYLIGVGAAVVAVIAAGYSIANRPPPAAATTTVATTPAPPTAVVAPVTGLGSPAREDAVEVAITATPPAATIYVDDAQVPGNPFKARYPKGGTHRVTASAPGYLPKTQEIAFETNLMSTIALEKAPPGASTAPPVWIAPRPGANAPPGPGAKDAAVVSVAPAADAQPLAPTTPTPPTQAPTGGTTTSSDHVNPNGGVAPTRKIDSTNPYAQ